MWAVNQATEISHMPNAFTIRSVCCINPHYTFLQSACVLRGVNAVIQPSSECVGVRVCKCVGVKD